MEVRQIQASRSGNRPREATPSHQDASNNHDLTDSHLDISHISDPSGYNSMNNPYNPQERALHQMGQHWTSHSFPLRRRPSHNLRHSLNNPNNPNNPLSNHLPNGDGGNGFLPVAPSSLTGVSRLSTPGLLSRPNSRYAHSRGIGNIHIYIYIYIYNNPNNPLR